ncbi:aromatic ring-opening dioxygenase LigA [Homoserinibacter sp. GY 40078]|uniref:aromatic ring-opening dioxygenase LigA n=1 Tax=Homoserinibacter sp. GY 40078 TaxID=2603275 RepID=UPI0011CBD18E|nr:aromatic ring-opening dioxygenase LigA [Homoserinibacter sp. GY 40078]TXK19705.1 aromatic ring-opening dioxygenase LigA [Homoserinibacter sp. GY 40078]
MSTTAPTSTTISTRHTGLVRLAGLAGIVGGALLIAAAGTVWIAVSTQLRAENITIPEDAIAFQGATVQGPITAYIQADIIQTHTLEMSEGKTYAELDRDDPMRATVMNASFLRASLFTSVVSFGVAALAAGIGVLSIFFGAALRGLAPSPKTVAAATETGPVATFTG